jgi:hypothetical protein
MFEKEAEERARKYINHKMAIHDIFELEVVQKDITRLLVDFVKETTKELEAQIEKMKNCKNCKNEKIEGACGHFTRVGICKNWEATE